MESVEDEGSSDCTSQHVSKTPSPMPSTQTVMQKNLCVNIIKNNLSSEDCLCVLEALVMKLSLDDLIHCCCELFDKIVSLKQMTGFIDNDFILLMIQALEKLYKNEEDNALYYWILWCLYSQADVLDYNIPISDVISSGKMFKEVLNEDEREIKKESMDENCVNIDEAHVESQCSNTHLKKYGVKRKKSNEMSIATRKKFVKETIIKEDDNKIESVKADTKLVKIEVVNKVDDKVNEDSEYSEEEGSNDSDFEINSINSTRKSRKMATQKNTSIVNQKRYECDLCLKVFPKMFSMRQHMKAHKDEDNWMKCNVCNRQFRDENHLREHTAKMHAPFLCELCGKALKSKKALEIHEHVHFPDKRPVYECPDCGKKLRSQNGMRDHRITVHVRARAKPYLCSECGQSFTFEKNLRKHLQRHKEKIKPFECEQCDKKFHTQAELDKHVDAAHIEGEFRCRLCLRVYPTKDRLRKHIQNIHTCPITDPEKIKNLTCDKCGRVYRRKWELDYHKKRVHIETDDFKCEFCNKLFASESLLADHRAVHTREARFFCEVCGQGFVHRSTYKAHLFKHNAEKFVCPICNKQFEVPFYLTRHIREVHKDHPMPVLPRFKYTGPTVSAKHHREMAEKAKATGQIVCGKERTKYEPNECSRKRKRRERMAPMKNVLIDKNKVTLDDVEALMINEGELKSLDDTELAVSNLPQGGGTVTTQAAAQFITIEKKNPNITVPKSLEVDDIKDNKIVEIQQQEEHLDLLDEQYVEEIHDEHVLQQLISNEQIELSDQKSRTKTIQLEIGEETQLIEVPEDAQFIQVGDNILQIDQIL